MTRRQLRTFAIWFAAICGVTSAVLWITAPLADAQPTCGGQNWNMAAPVTCTKTRTIDGTKITVTLVETGNGALTVTYALNRHRPVDTPLHIVTHNGISGDAGPQAEVFGVIPTGYTRSLPLTIPTAACGQIDIRAIYNDSRGRVAGPYITNLSCTPTTTSSSSTTVPPSSSVPTTSTPVPSTTPGTVPGTPTVPGSQPPPTLPPTGNDSTTGVFASLGLAVVGGGLILLARRRATS